MSYIYLQGGKKVKIKDLKNPYVSYYYDRFKNKYIIGDKLMSKKYVLNSTITDKSGITYSVLEFETKIEFIHYIEDNKLNNVIFDKKFIYSYNKENKNKIKNNRKKWNKIKKNIKKNWKGKKDEKKK